MLLADGGRRPERRSPSRGRSARRGPRWSAATPTFATIAAELGPPPADGPARPAVALGHAADAAAPVRRPVLRGRAAGRGPGLVRGRRGRRARLADAGRRAARRWPRARSGCGCRRARRSSSSSTPTSIAEIRERLAPGRLGADRGRGDLARGHPDRHAGRRRRGRPAGLRLPRRAAAARAGRSGRPDRPGARAGRSSWPPPAAARSTAIALTQVDPDHAAGAEALAEMLGVPVVAGPGGGRPLPYAVRELADGGDRRRSATCRSGRSHTPGPRPDHLAFIVGDACRAGDQRRPRRARAVPGPSSGPWNETGAAASRERLREPRSRRRPGCPVTRPPRPSGSGLTWTAPDRDARRWMTDDRSPLRARRPEPPDEAAWPDEPRGPHLPDVLGRAPGRGLDLRRCSPLARLVWGLREASFGSADRPVAASARSLLFELPSVVSILLPAALLLGIRTRRSRLRTLLVGDGPARGRRGAARPRPAARSRSSSG